MVDDHGAHDEHHALPPPEPDNIAFGSVIFWGFGTFALVLGAVFALSGHFWGELAAEEQIKAEQGYVLPKIQAQNSITKQRVETYRKLENGQVQVPVERAMELMVNEKR
jgi:hypothetical protein